MLYFFEIRNEILSQNRIKSFIFRFFVKKRTMNLEEIKSRLDKLNRYYEFLSSLSGNVSALDRDVLLMQLREFYEAVLFLEFSKSSTAVQKAIEPKVEEKTEIVQQKLEQQEKKEEAIKKIPTLVFNDSPLEEISKEQATESTLLINTETVVETNTDTVILSKEDHKHTEIVKVENTKLETETVKEEPQILPINTVLKQSEITSSDTDFNPDFEELFIFKQATDLAAKLSESPVSDLSKVLGINEKLLFTKELFGGDSKKFNDAVTVFNSAGIFDKARSFMEYNLIEQYNWLSKEKKSTARDFIKLIRRRYL
jgi:hypothetical protein